MDKVIKWEDELDLKCKFEQENTERIIKCKIIEPRKSHSVFTESGGK